MHSASSVVFTPRAEVAATALEVLSISVSSTERHVDAEDGAFALATFDLERATVALDDVSRAGQANARASDAALDIACPLKPLEHAVHVGSRDTDPMVFHFDDRPVAVDPARAEKNVATLGAVLDG